MKWHKLIIRPATEEEYQANPDCDLKFDGIAPLNCQEVLVSYDEKVHADYWGDNGNGGGFENYDGEVGVMYWTSMPEPPTETNYMEIPVRLLREYIDNNYIHQPTADTHVGYNRALGDLRNWLRVLEQEENHD